MKNEEIFVQRNIQSVNKNNFIAVITVFSKKLNCQKNRVNYLFV